MKTLKDIYDILKSMKYEIDEDMFVLWNQIYATSYDTLIYLLACDKGGNGNPMLRYAPSASFDRWANSGTWMDFETYDEMYDYIKNNTLQIYMDCLRELTEDVEEMRSDE